MGTCDCPMCDTKYAKNVNIINSIKGDKKILNKGLIGIKKNQLNPLLNCLLQCFSHTTELKDYFLGQYKNVNNNNNLSNQFYSITNKIWLPKDNNPISSVNFGKDVNDLKVLINYIIETLHKELNQPNNNKVDEYQLLDESEEKNIIYNEFYRKLYGNNNSIIFNLFYGIEQTLFKCQNCYKEKYNYNSYTFIEFPLEEIYKFNYPIIRTLNNASINMMQSFTYLNEHYINDNNKVECKKCSSLTEDKIQKTLYTLPKKLIIVINRENAQNINYDFIVEKQLDLNDYVTNTEERNDYRLYACIVANEKNYVAFCLHKDNNIWYKFNDDEVKECNNDEYLTGMHSVLFYEKIE